MKRNTTAGVLVLGGALIGGVLLAPAAQAVTGSSFVAAELPKAGNQTAYVQRADTVTVYRNGKVQAELTVESAAHPRGKGKLVVTVEAKKDFSMRAGQFLWEDEGGGDNEAVNPKRKISVPADTTKTVTIAFDGVGNGDAIWVPNKTTVAGAWLIEGREVEGAANLLPAGYVQRGSTVTVYKSGKTVARLTPQDAVLKDGKGTLTVEVEALKKVTVNPGAFVWEDADGGDHAAVKAQKKVTVKAGTTKTITVKYADVSEAGGVFWAPREDLVAGAWKVG